MGFFKDFKRDFAQAVNELMPDKAELANEYDDEDMVNTFDENDNMEIAPEDMLEDIDDIINDNGHAQKPQLNIEDNNTVVDNEKKEEIEDVENIFDVVPEAEIINGQSEVDIDNMSEEISYSQSIVKEVLEGNGDSVNDETVMVEITDTINNESDADEIVSIDELDEDDMLENTEDALNIEPELEDNTSEGELGVLNLNKALEEAIQKREEEKENSESDIIFDNEEIKEDGNMAGTLIEELVDDKDKDISSVLTEDTTYITKGTVITGNVETDGGIDVIGTVTGNVKCGGKLIIGGTIKGNVDAGEIYSNAAKIEGDINTEGSIKIGVGSVIVGNVFATSAVIAGAVNGDIDVHGPVIVDSTAVIMGNIKSRSVQINNGAVIEGFCSQCYSEIDVKSFFG